MMRVLVLVSWLAACNSADHPNIPDAAMAADANGVDAAPPREMVTTTQPLQVGELVEGIMHGSSSDLASFHLEAPAGSLSWNLHGHQGSGTQVVYEELNKTTVDYQFVPAFAADWYLLLRNDGATDINVKVAIGLYGTMTWRWQ